jgi:ribosomal protein S18 acetylase RimI-like enzyme
VVPRPRRGDGRDRRQPLSITEDGWLGERFGHPVFTVGPAAGSDDIREHDRAPALYQARVACEDVARASELASAGLRIVNTGITLGREGGDVAAPAGVEVRVGEPGRDDDAAKIARSAFRFDRFHLDPDVPAAVADRIKHDWVVNALAGNRGDHVLVAMREDEVVGFLAVVVEGERSIIDLMAVHPDHRGRGAGRALVARFLAGAERAEVGTQAANVRATRFYEALGFRAVRATYDMHMMRA